MGMWVLSVWSWCGCLCHPSGLGVPSHMLFGVFVFFVIPPWAVNVSLDADLVVDLLSPVPVLVV